MYGVVLHAHPVRGESHNQRNTTGEVATEAALKTHLKQLLAAEKIFMLKQKLSNLYKICSNSVKKLGVIVYALCIRIRSQMLYTNGSFEICQERMFVKQYQKNS